METLTALFHDVARIGDKYMSQEDRDAYEIKMADLRVSLFDTIGESLPIQSRELGEIVKRLRPGDVIDVNIMKMEFLGCQPSGYRGVPSLLVRVHYSNGTSQEQLIDPRSIIGGIVKRSKKAEV